MEASAAVRLDAGHAAHLEAPDAIDRLIDHHVPPHGDPSAGEPGIDG